MTPEERRAEQVAERLSPKREVRPVTDVDLAPTSLMNAMGMIGAGPYVLTVHPVRHGWAKHHVCTAFPGLVGAQWCAEITIETKLFPYTDEWSLENADLRYYSPGA